MLLDQVEALADAGQHAERQHIDLQHAERVDVVLVPLDEGAVLHGGVVDRHGLVEPLAGQHEAADVLGEVAREAEQLVAPAPIAWRISGLAGSSPASRMCSSGISPSPSPQISAGERRRSRPP